MKNSELNDELQVSESEQAEFKEQTDSKIQNLMKNV